MESKKTQGPDPRPERFRLGEWLVLPRQNKIVRRGEKVSLQNLSMRVLVSLAERQGGVVTYDELLDELWPNRIVGDEAVHRRVADLRRHMRSGIREETFIENIARKGYRLAVPVKPVEAAKRGMLLWVVAAAVLGLAVVFMVLAQRDETERSDPKLLARETVEVAVESTPPGAMVSYKPYAEPDAAWQPIGLTPFKTELPTGTHRLRFVADGHATVIMASPNPSLLFNNVGRDFFTVRLPPANEVPDGMVFVPAGERRIPLAGFYTDFDLGDFYIGRTEVSNEEYGSFVDAGGYESDEYWQGFEKFRDRFVDSTGKPGPASWINGEYPPGGEKLPVTGVSWYEAMAYARFRGMKLPTARHWARAALGMNEGRRPLAPDLLALARTSDPGPGPVDEELAMSTWGSVNMIGNVQEWMTTRDGESRLTLGTSFAGPQWQYALATVSLPTQRLPDQGIRLAMYGDVPDPPIQLSANISEVPQVTAAEMATFKKEFEYEPGNVTVGDVMRESSVDDEDWVTERYIIEWDALAEPLPILVFRPREVTSPLQSVVFLPPGDSYTTGLPSDDIDITRYGIDFVVRSGRALVWPIIAGTHERHRPRERRSPQELSERWLRLKQVRRAEIGAVIDFLEFSGDFDGDKIAVLGASLGAFLVSPHILVVEKRIDTAVLMSAMLGPFDSNRLPDIVNPNTYWPHITMPVLVLNGRYDISTHQLHSRAALLETLGTADEDKRGINYESSHWPLPPHRVEKDVTDWLNERLGYVE